MPFYIATVQLSLGEGVRFGDSPIMALLKDDFSPAVAELYIHLVTLS